MRWTVDVKGMEFARGGFEFETHKITTDKLPCDGWVAIDDDDERPLLVLAIVWGTRSAVPLGIIRTGNRSPLSEPGGMDYYHIGHITFAQHHTQHQSIRSQTTHGMIVCLTIPPRSDPWKSPSYSPITGFFETTQLIEQSPSTTSLKYSVREFA